MGASMYLDRAKFFAAVRQSGVAGKPLRQRSVESLEAILDAFALRYPAASAEQIAYCMATARHEAWSPAKQEIDYAIEEIGGASQPYGKTGFYGRGMPQVTHRENYEKVGKALGVDLVANPKLALRKDISAGALVMGSMLGWYRKGHSLPRYFTPTKADPVGARNIINGDVAKNGKLIAGHYAKFLTALKLAATTEPQKKPPVTSKDAAVGSGAAAGAGTVAVGIEQGWGAWEWAIACGALVGVICLLIAAYLGWKAWKKRQLETEVAEAIEADDAAAADAAVIAAKTDEPDFIAEAEKGVKPRARKPRKEPAAKKRPAPKRARKKGVA